MTNFLRGVAFCCFVAGASSWADADPSKPRMFWVPLGEGPAAYASGTTVVTVNAGETVVMA
jgi:hypothetical protein